MRTTRGESPKTNPITQSHERYKWGTIQQYVEEKNRLAPFEKMRADAIEKMISKEEAHLRYLEECRRKQTVFDMAADFLLGRWRMREGRSYCAPDTGAIGDC